MYLTITFIIGSCLASYLMVLSQPYQYRIWRRSHCDHCFQPLAWYQLIPIYSSLIGRSNCLTCMHQPGRFYGIAELILGLSFVLNVWSWPHLVPQMIFQSYILLAFHISLWDWQWRQIPIIDLFLFAFLTLIWAFYNQNITIAPLIILGILSALSILWKLSKKPWVLAKGDWILLLLASCWLSPRQLPFFSRTSRRSRSYNCAVLPAALPNPLFSLCTSYINSLMANLFKYFLDRF